MRSLRDRYRKDARCRAVQQALASNSALLLGASHGSFAAMMLAAAYANLDGEHLRLVVCPDPDSLQDDLETLGVSSHVLLEMDDHDPDDEDWSPDRVALGRRLAALEAASEGAVLLATPRSVDQPVPNVRAIVASSIRLKPGDTCDLYALAEQLVDQGYSVSPVVEEPGQIAQRGGIVDLWPWANNNPIRIEFFDDEIDTLRRFDPETQEGISRLDELHIEGSGGGLHATEPLWEQLDPGPIVVLADVPLASRLKKPHGRHEIRFARTLEQGALDAACVSVDRFIGDMHKDLAELSSVENEGTAIAVCSRNEAAAETLGEQLADHAISASVELGRLSSGWRDMEAGLLVIHDFELNHRKPTPRRKHRKVAGGAPLSSLSDLKSGDYVVHLNHGIGRFRGMATLERRGYLEDFLLLEYRDSSKLYIPVSAIDLVQKYIGGAGRHPELDILGGKAWQKRKAKAEKAIADLSAELVAAQAARIAAGGITYTNDGKDQRRFEASFPFEETEDQLTCLAEIKGDMERPVAMDRLLCGDVGFGKTELAMRAAFKAVADGKQVAVLAPTTLLTEQHATTFSERFADWPVEIACANRFKKLKERKEIFQRVKQGEIDILIGTHAILNKDLRFADLGLLIIDEEQRFGVRHKEHLKQLRHGVDVLTLSATPIPRTLHFSMLGLRDISVLAEAPADRLAVETRAAPWDKALIRQAIERELERGGQVFMVHNRVHDIEHIAFKLSRIVPDLNYEIVHGQMPEGQIASAMQRFKRGESQCLLATSIIESGLDIPNANTMIVNNAHAFGLSQLHQIRGRIGRFSRQAWCYLLIPAQKGIGDDAGERLDAIVEYAELGAGFKLAMRDMELRGAGNLLGGQQSGHIEAIGYELYCKLLGNAVERQGGTAGAAVGTKPSELGGAVIGFAIDGYIPDEYCEAPALKFALHKMLDSAKNITELEAVALQARDRYGPMPSEVVRLFRAKALRRRLSELGITRVDCEERHLKLQLSGSLPQELQNADIPNVIHLQFSGHTLACFLKTKPEQDELLRLLCQLSQLDLPFLGHGL